MINVPENPNEDIEIIDFSFGPVLGFGWLNFSIFFLDKLGGIKYILPIFPEELFL